MATLYKGLCILPAWGPWESGLVKTSSARVNVSLKYKLKLNGDIHRETYKLKITNAVKGKIKETLFLTQRKCSSMYA
ncbi:hypothetical protein KDK_60950 [Dictyobacter kobayashii]|uniref:Uncharacterized protein n=1 Tax=Dictyobacter kobayashii TaxID=2014872 RepID=A0A402AT94_9CHLR|nr:hypothetical protein KDK_60950 [Dictyobacter kobayashii]